MTIYFYVNQTPTEKQLSEITKIPFFDKDNINISVEHTEYDEIIINITPLQEIFSIGVLDLIQKRLHDIFFTLTVFVR